MDLSSPHAAAGPASDGGLVENAAIGGELLQRTEEGRRALHEPTFPRGGSAGVAVARILVGSVYYNNTTTTTEA